ncbi:MAG: polyprenyl synthetase family protein [Bacteroidales bacterium]
MDIKEIKKELGEHWSGYQKTLTEALSNDNALLTQINTYLITNAGKQLRPILSLLTALACGKINKTNYYCAAVSEMIHTATLLHDDVADNGDMRRGVPTVKAVFNQAASVLTGDYWLARALSILTDKCEKEVLTCFAKALQELSEGEIIQMEKAESLSTTEQDYYNIITRKTASLFMATVKSAALCVSAPKDYVNAVTKYAYHLGLAFQIRDDIFDYSPSMNTGKMAGLDLKERKITLPLLGAMLKCPNKSQFIIELISKIPNSPIKGGEICENEKSIINEVNEFVYAHEGLKYAQTSLEEQIQNAVLALSILPDTPAKQRLIQLAQYLGTRNS